MRKGFFVKSLHLDETVMPKARKRKVPVTGSSSTRTSSSKPQSSRTVIRRFHVLLKEQAKFEAQKDPNDALALSAIQHEIEELGGLEAYQRMSAIGQGNDRGGGSEKVLISWLKELGMAQKSDHNRLRCVGFRDCAPILRLTWAFKTTGGWRTEAG